jgi:aryl-alcohol dehydrogenase-like predicted oxidoreductase
MRQRDLGKSGVKVSCIGLGCMGMSEFYGPSDDKASERLIQRAIDLGINFFDTADSFGVGHNEMLLGHVLRGGVRDKIVVTTKFGLMRRTDGAYLGVNGHPDYVKSSCDMSLRRLGLDHIDLYLQQKLDPNVPVEDTVGAMADLVKAGKVRFLGLSEVEPEVLRRAHRIHPLTALQSELSLWSREAMGSVLETCRDLGLGFIASSPLGKGFLAGQFKSHNQFLPGDYRARHPRMNSENFEANRRHDDNLERMAQVHGHTAGQLALAWVLAQGEDIIPIPGTRREYFLMENIAGARLNLSEGVIREIGAMIPHMEIRGTRHGEML